MFQLIFAPVEFFPNKDFRTQIGSDNIPHESDYMDSIDELVSNNQNQICSLLQNHEAKNSLL